MTISDPLEVVLDRVMDGELDDREVRYTINRFAALGASDGEATSQDNLMSRSLGAFLARARDEEEAYFDKVEELWAEARKAVEDGPESVVVLLASQSGLPLDLLERLRARLQSAQGALPTSIEAWVEWTLNWLCEDTESREHLLQDIRGSALSAAGRTAKSPFDESVLMAILPGIKGWLSGKPLNELEKDLGGDPNSKSATARMCPRARELISTFIPRGLSFVMGVISRMVKELDLYSSQTDLDESMMQSLTAAVRRGFDTNAKLEYANAHKGILGRVQLHKLYDQNLPILDFDLDDEL